MNLIDQNPPVGNVVKASDDIDLIVDHSLALRVSLAQASWNGCELPGFRIPNLSSACFKILTKKCHLCGRFLLRQTPTDLVNLAVQYNGPKEAPSLPHLAHQLPLRLLAVQHLAYDDDDDGDDDDDDDEDDNADDDG